MLNFLDMYVLLTFRDIINYIVQTRVILTLVINMGAIILIGVLVLNMYKSIQAYGACVAPDCQQIEKKKITLNLTFLIGLILFTIFVIPRLINLL
jgi:hypothetical protein